MVKQMKKPVYKIFVGLIVALAIVMLLPFQTFASGQYYSTWDKYKESGNPTATWNDVTDAMDNVFETAVEKFKSGDYDGAYKCVNDGYYGYYETTGFERIAMGRIAGSRKTEVELQFSSCKSVCKNKGSLADFEKEINTLKSMIREDANKLDGTDSSSNSSSSTTDGSTAGANAAAFAASLSIIVREGIEAILIIGAIVAYMYKQYQDDIKMRKKSLRSVYVGCVAGIGLSFVLAAVLQAFKIANSAHQELIEGITALIAVCVLFWTCNWILSKTSSKSWTKYIKNTAGAAANKGSVFVLAFTAFLAVFREGAEVVLFYQPMLSTYDPTSIWSGFLVGCVIIAIVFIIMRFGAVKLPISPLFKVTSIIMAVMCVSFLGAGIKELIEADVITYVSPDYLKFIPTNDLMDVLGIYPTWQTLGPQIALTIVFIILFVRQSKKNKLEKLQAEQEAKAMEQEQLADGQPDAKVVEGEVEQASETVNEEKQNSGSDTSDT